MRRSSTMAKLASQRRRSAMRRSESSKLASTTTTTKVFLRSRTHEIIFAEPLESARAHWRTTVLKRTICEGTASGRPHESVLLQVFPITASRLHHIAWDCYFALLDYPAWQGHVWFQAAAVSFQLLPLVEVLWHRRWYDTLGCTFGGPR